jgi:hypothetical protein
LKPNPVLLIFVSSPTRWRPGAIGLGL